MAMIDAFYIFTKGGLLLWSTQLVKVKGNPLDRLIKEVLLEERVGENTFKVDAYSLKWKLLSEMDLFFVVVYQGILQIAYLDALLNAASKEFLNHVGDAFGNGMSIKRVDFDSTFLEVRKRVDKLQMELKRARVLKPVVDNKKGKDGQNNTGEAIRSESGKSGNDTGAGDDESAEDGDKKIKGARAAIQNRGKGAKKEEPAKEAKKSKEKRTWGGEGKYNAKTVKELDFSKNKSGDEDFERQKAAFVGDANDDEEWKKSEDDVESLASSSEAENDENDGATQKTGRLGGLFKSLTKGVKNLTGGAVLADEDLNPILKSFRTALMSKNCAADVATKLSDSVRQSLVGRQTERFTSMNSTVKASLQEAMEVLLTPKKSVDVLRAALAAKSAGRVFTIVFLGVNGVGKSTNLAKVAYYLKHKGGLDVLICACDTFRAGAVEQLKTHSRCLEVPLFERGYGKDPSDVAKAAIQHAREKNHDVVLVDTAGRMQDNEPLMRSLAKLVHVNAPDLVLFVGEALVGNDAIDQVTKFNRSLIEYSHNQKVPRGIDGMLLTKYDTVDDKVGAALSMVYVTGQPIVFVGTGQKYTHLRKLQAKEVVRNLLS